jgi:DNA-binding MarR family transcriptional regulator
MLEALQDPRVTSWSMLLEAQAAVRRVLARELDAALGLPPTWFEVLLRLGRTPGGRLRMSELATAVAFSSGGFTRLADRMEAAGLLRREACRTDRRSAFAVLTPEGRAMLERAAAVHLEGLQRHYFVHLTAEEAVLIEAAMRRVHTGQVAAAEAAEAEAAGH